MQSIRMELTPKFVIYAIISIIIILVGWEFRSVLISIFSMLFIAYILNAGIRPMVNTVQQWRVLYPIIWLGERLFPNQLKKYPVLTQIKVGRPVAIATIYLGGLLLLGLLIILLTNEFVSQIRSLVEALPSILDRLIGFIEDTFPVINEILPVNQLQQELGIFVSQFAESPEFRNLISGENVLIIFNQTLGIFSSAAEVIISLITVVIISIYMLQRQQPIYEGALRLIPDDYSKNIRNVLEKIEYSLGSWLAGQLFLMMIIGLITYFIVLLPGAFDASYTLDEFAFPIAILAGLLEAIPNIGPTLTLLIAVLLALGTSGFAVVIYIVIAFIILQNLENVFIVPMIMKRAVGIDPILSIMGILAGFQVAGVIGALLAIPIIGITQIMLIAILEEYKRNYNRRPKKLI